MDKQVSRWFIGVATAATLTLGGWNFTTVASTQTEVAVQKERVDNLKEQLKQMDSKLDRLLEKLEKK